MTSEDNIVGTIDRMTSDYYCYAWTINNFCFCCEFENLKSPRFITGLKNENIWFLELIEEPEWIDIYLTLEDTTKNTKVVVEYEFSILNKCKQKAFVHRNTKIFNKAEFHGHEKFIMNADVIKCPCILIPNKELTILCEIKSANIRLNNQHRDVELVDHLQNLFEDPKYTDAIIVVGEKSFHVHKAILVSRSLWFKAAFEGGMKEQQENKVTISNYDYEVMREVLRFIYTGQVKGVINFMDKLLDAAVFYQLDKLKTICSTILGDNLSLKNALQTLNLADTHNVIDLKKKALYFMSLHTNDLVNVDKHATKIEKSRTDE